MPEPAASARSTHWRGYPASPGRVEAPVWRPVQPAPVANHGVREPESAAEARHRLADAIRQAAAKAEAELRAASGTARDILTIQHAILTDDTLLASVGARLRDGVAPDMAWRTMLEAEIASYRMASDPMFRARAADFEDVRDRVLEALAGLQHQPVIPTGVVYCAADITPRTFLAHDWTGGGIALGGGGPLAHVTALARQRGVPMLTGLVAGDQCGPDARLHLPETGTPVLLDADAGEMFVAYATKSRTRRDTPLPRPAPPAIAPLPADVTLMVNVSTVDDLAGIAPGGWRGVGLVRTEFLFAGKPSDETDQLNAFRKLLAHANGQPVIIRLFDHGGDKPGPDDVRNGMDRTSNPLLGMRGIRRILAQPDDIVPQLRALLRAAADGDIRILVPMVTHPGEVDAVSSLVADEARALAAAGMAHRVPPLGIMVEVPAAALTLERFAAADFFSIGTNDLAQYTLAIGRDEPHLAHRLRADDPAVLALIGMCVRAAAAMGKPINLCGEAAGDATQIEALFDAGVRSFSVAPASFAAASHALAACRHRQADVKEV